VRRTRTSKRTTLAPNWVCDRRDKLAIYARDRVAHAWLIDPASRILEVFRLDGDTGRVINVWAEDVKVRAEPFDAIELDLAALWAHLPPKT